MIDTEVIESQLSLSCEKAIASIDLVGGVIDNQCRGNQQSTFTFVQKAITSVDPGGGATLMIDAEAIDSQLSLSHEKVITSVDPGGSPPP